jgi:hypothetical protein
MNNVENASSPVRKSCIEHKREKYPKSDEDFLKVSELSRRPRYRWNEKITTRTCERVVDIQQAP